MPGDGANGDARVDAHELSQAQAAIVQHLGAANHVNALLFGQHGIDLAKDQRHSGFDTDSNGEIDGFDLQQIERNVDAGLVVVELVGDQDAPSIGVSLERDTGGDLTDGITIDPTIRVTVADESLVTLILIGIDSPPSSELIGSFVEISPSGDFTISSNDLLDILSAPLGEGIHTIRFAAIDELGNSTTDPTEITFTLLVDNEAPTIDTIAQQLAEEDNSFRLELGAIVSDADTGDIVDIRVTLPTGDPLPAWLKFDTDMRMLSGVPTNADVGDVDIQVTLTVVVFTIVVENVNDSPTAIPAPNQMVDEKTPFSHDVSIFFTDVDIGDVLQYTATAIDGSPLPAWLTIDGTTGLLKGTPSSDDIGVIDVKVVSSDLQSASAMTNVNITVIDVNEFPIVTGVLIDQIIDEDDSFEFDISPFFADPDTADTLQFRATRSNDSTLPEWLSINSESGSLSGTPGNDDVGSLQVAVTADDGRSGTVTSVFELTVNNVNDDPRVVVPLANQTAVEDVLFSLGVIDTFEEIDAGDSLTFSMAQSDGSPLPAWLVFDDTSALLSGTPTNDDVGSISITFSAEDESGQMATDSFELIVTNTNDAPLVTMPIPDQAVDQDIAFSLSTRPFFDDIDAGDVLSLSATLSNGGALPSWLTIDATTGILSGTPSNDDVGILTIRVTATDAMLASVSETLDVTVHNVNDSPAFDNQSFSLISKSPARTIVGTIAVSDPDVGDTLSFTVVQGDPQGIFLVDSASGQITVVESAELTAGRMFVLDVEVTDSGTPAISVNAAITIQVADNLPPMATMIPDQLTNEDEVFAFDVKQFFSDPDEADTITFSASRPDDSNLPDWLVFDDALGTLSGTPGNSDVGTASIKVTATDLFGDHVSDTFDITVLNTNDSPVLVSLPPTQIVAEDALFNFSAAEFFADPDVGDSLILDANLAGAGPLPGWLNFSRDCDGVRDRSNPWLRDREISP